MFGFSYSINLITGTIIGGLTSIWGGALGAAIIIFLRELLRDLALPLWESVIMGALTVIVLISVSARHRRHRSAGSTTVWSAGGRPAASR